MTTLYIIGNGFDLWHNLPTSYDHFYEFAREALNELESYFCIDTTKSGPWHDFENCLGTFDWHQFYEAHDNTDISSESFKPSEAYGLEDELNEQSNDIVDSIQEQFREWIEGIDISVATKKMKFDSGIRFITFNYTSTLQNVYGVNTNDVLHIHGRANSAGRLIFGHGETREEEPEVDESGDSNRTVFSDAEGAAKYPFYALKKPINEVITEHHKYFESLNGVMEIVVMGHSLNNIDLPYFEEIAKRTQGCRWFLYCYTEFDKEHHVQQLIRCGVSEDKILTCAYDIF